MYLMNKCYVVCIKEFYCYECILYIYRINKSNFMLYLIIKKKL